MPDPNTLLLKQVPQAIFICPHCGDKVACAKLEHYPALMGYWPCCRKSAGLIHPEGLQRADDTVIGTGTFNS